MNPNSTQVIPSQSSPSETATSLKSEVSKPQEKLRAYKIDGHIYPSVTSVISYVGGLPPEMKDWIARNSALRMWREIKLAAKEGRKPTQKELLELAMDEPRRLLKDSQIKGVTLHKWAEDWFNGLGDPKEIPKEYQGYWNSFTRWTEYFPIKMLLQEEVLFSHKYKYAGRMDLYGTLSHEGKNKRVLVDFKTSNIRSDYTWGLQLAAYKKCLETMGYPVDECYIMWMRSHGFYEFILYDDPFDHFLKVREAFTDKVKKKNPEFELAFTPEEFISKIKTTG